jgi:GMP reductase
VLDVANGGVDRFSDFVKQIRSEYPEKVIIAGNVCTSELTAKLIDAGADIIKLGIGPGSVCTTRAKAGVGRPQLSTILECAKTAMDMGARVIADGGIQEAGHVGIAFGAGADFVMIGGMLAATDETFGSAILDVNTGIKYKKYYGDSSGHKDVNPIGSHGTSEGRQLELVAKGPVEQVLLDILGGLRSTCTYTNSKNLEDLKNNTEFYRVNPHFKINKSLIS